MIKIFFEGVNETKINLTLKTLEEVLKKNNVKTEVCKISSVLDGSTFKEAKTHSKATKVLLKEKQDVLVLFDGCDNKSDKNKLKCLKEFLRYNNSKFKLLVVLKNEPVEVAVSKITNKINELVEDSKINEADKWFELYKIDVEEFKTPDDYFLYKLGYKKKLVKTIEKFAGGKKIAEMGCGTGLTAGFLSKRGHDVTAVDLSDQMLVYANKIAQNSNVIAPCTYIQDNILTLNKVGDGYGVCFSNGVFEHFDDEEIVKTLSKQLQISDYVVFGIPSLYFDMHEKMLGNERCLSRKEWRALIKRAGGKLVKETSFHYYNWVRRLLEVKKWFKPKAFLMYVVTK